MEEYQYIRPETILARMTNKIMLILHLDPSKIRNQINAYAHLISKNKTAVGLYQTKINFASYLTKPTMTIKTFFKFLIILRAQKVDFHVTITLSNGKVIELKEKILIPSEDNDELDEEKELRSQEK
jgi:hypothetical protein